MFNDVETLGCFKTRAQEILDPANEYYSGVYILNLTKEAGLGIVKLKSNNGMMSTLAMSVAPFTAISIALAFIGADIYMDPVTGKVDIRDKALILLVVDASGKFSALKYQHGGWSAVEHFNEEAELMTEIWKDSSFDLSAVEEHKGPVKADTIII